MLLNIHVSEIIYLLLSVIHFCFLMLGYIEGIIIGRSKSHKTDGIIKDN